jgi:Kef-type K+ transport system membrane component KefB
MNRTRKPRPATWLNLVLLQQSSYRRQAWHYELGLILASFLVHLLTIVYFSSIPLIPYIISQYELSKPRMEKAMFALFVCLIIAYGLWLIVYCLLLMAYCLGRIPPI